MSIEDIRLNPYNVFQFKNDTKWIKKLWFIKKGNNPNIIGIFNDKLIAEINALCKWENERIINLK